MKVGSVEMLYSVRGSKGLFTNDVIFFRGFWTPPPPLVIKNHILANPPSPPRHEKSLFTLPPFPPRHEKSLFILPLPSIKLPQKSLFNQPPSQI